MIITSLLKMNQVAGARRYDGWDNYFLTT